MDLAQLTARASEALSGGSDFNFDDNAFRLAAATRLEDFDLLAAYSYRRKGNYYSGKGGSQRYETEGWLDKAKAQSNASVPGAGTSYVAQLYHPGYEVTNTSSDIRTTLLKGTWYLADQQSVKLSYMHSDMAFGESSPFVSSYTTFRGLDGTLNTGLQSPYSEVKQDTYAVNYAWNPDDNALINLQAGVWMTRNESSRHQTGDSVYGVGANGDATDRDWDNYVSCKYQGTGNCANEPSTPPDRLPNTDGRYNLIAKALQLSNHDRWGVNLSNRMVLGETFNLILAGDFSHEKLEERNNADGKMVNEITWAATHMGPRSGTRQQYNFSFNNEWTPLPWLVLSAGARYSDYNSFDDGLARHRANQDNGWSVGTTTTGQSARKQKSRVLTTRPRKRRFIQVYFESILIVSSSPRRVSGCMRPPITSFINLMEGCQSHSCLGTGLIHTSLGKWCCRRSSHTWPGSSFHCSTLPPGQVIS